MHVPVSRVEPFTRVYNSSNAKMDAAFQTGSRVFSSVLVQFRKAEPGHSKARPTE